MEKNTIKIKFKKIIKIEPKKEKRSNCQEPSSQFMGKLGLKTYDSQSSALCTTSGCLSRIYLTPGGKYT